MNVYQKILGIFTSFILIVSALSFLLLSGNVFSVIFFFSIVIPLTVILYFIFNNAPEQKSAVPSILGKPSPQVEEPDNQVLYVISTFWPLVFFSDTLVIREKTLSFVNKNFFWSGWSDTIPIKEVTAAILSTDILFASLTIIRKDPEREYRLSFLKKREALEAKNIIDGLLLIKDKLLIIPNNIPLEKKLQIIKEFSKENISAREINKL